MTRDEKINEIVKLFHNNIIDLNEIKIWPEHKSTLFCLFIGNKVVSVDIQKSFIDNRTIDEIKSYFSVRHIYHTIISNSRYKMSDNNGIFIYINDPICRER